MDADQQGIAQREQLADLPGGGGLSAAENGHSLYTHEADAGKLRHPPSKAWEEECREQDRVLSHAQRRKVQVAAAPPEVRWCTALLSTRPAGLLLTTSPAGAGAA